MNFALIIGRLTRDAQFRQLPSGKLVANLDIATNESWKDKSGQKQERTEFHRVTVFGDWLEKIGDRLVKGQEVKVEGKIQTRKFESKDGPKEVTEIEAKSLSVL